MNIPSVAFGRNCPTAHTVTAADTAATTSSGMRQSSLQSIPLACMSADDGGACDVGPWRFTSFVDLTESMARGVYRTQNPFCND